MLFSCAEAPQVKGKKTAVKKQKIVASGTDAGKSEYNALEKLYNDKKYPEYLADSASFSKKHPDSRYASEIIYKRGTILLASQKFREASAEMNNLTKNYSDSPYYNGSVYYWGLSEYKQGNTTQALSVLDKADFGRSGLDAETKIKILVLKGNLLSAASQDEKAFDSYADAYGLSMDEEVRSRLKSSMLTEIDKLKTEDLESMEGKYSSQDIGSYIIFALGERYIQKGNSLKAKDKFTKFQSLYPQHEYSVQVDNYMSRLKNIDQVDPYTVGVILPLTGKNAAFGQKSLMGIQLAAGIFGDKKNTKPPIKLAIMDSQSDPEVARMAAAKLVTEDHVLAIVGPLGNDEGATTASQCTMSGVPNVSLSQKDDLDGLGQYVFRMAMSNRNQIRRLVDYAMDKMAMTKFGIVYPEDKYGQELTKYFWEEVLKKGGEITAVESYETGQTDFRDQVKKLLGIYYVGTRLMEYNDLKAKLEEDQTQNPKKKERARDLTLPPIQSFDAVFIPDDAKIAAQIAPYLPYYDAKGVVLLGPNTWNSPQLITRGQNNVNGALFVDGFTSLTAITESRSFVKNFTDTFKTAPGVLEAQAYDALNIVIAAMNNVSNRDAFRNNVTSIGSFTGATGKMKIEKNGDIDKQLFVLGVEKGKIILKD
jgi:ABC-type branched-subunit amino acid transport system substrate-binding protein